MRRLLSILVLLVIFTATPLTTGVTAPTKTRPTAARKSSARVVITGPMVRRVPALDLRGYPVISGPGEFIIGGTAFGQTAVYTWPKKTVELAVKDAHISRVAKLLSDQTGIRFIVGSGVPANLKVTAYVSGLELKQFLDSLCSASGLVYIAQSTPPLSSQTGIAGGKTAPEEGYVTTCDSRELIFRTAMRARPVTHIILCGTSGPCIVANMGRVWMNLRNTDPVAAAATLINRFSGAGYTISSLDAFLSNEDTVLASEIRRAAKRAPRRKLNLTLKDVPVPEALAQIAEKGRLYIGVQRPGVPVFTIIPDVVIGKDILPGLRAERWSTDIQEGTAADQRICMGYMKQLASAVLDYAREHDGTLPDAGKWIALIPVTNPVLQARLPSYQRLYGLNAYLSETKLSAISKPSQTVLLFESDKPDGFGTEKDVIARVRHLGGVVYAFADGHVEIRKTAPNFKP